MKGRAELALLFNAFIWGSTFVVIKGALADVTPLLFLALRFSVASLVLLILLRGRPRLPDRPALKAGFVAGAFLFGGFVFQTVGLRLTTAPKSAFLTGLSIPMVPLLAGIVYQNRPRVAEVSGAALACAGMALLAVPGDLSGVNTGDVLTIAGALGFASHILALDRYSRTVGFEMLAIVQVMTMAGLAWLLFRPLEAAEIRWTAGLSVAIAVTGVFGTAVAYSLQSWAQRHTTATRAALIFAMEPVFAWLTSWVVAGETLSRRGAAGAALILCGIVLVDLKPRNLQQHPSN